MLRHLPHAVLLAACVTVGTGVALADETKAAAPIVVTSSNWKFTNEAIVAHVGKATTLSLTSSEGTHGIKSDELGIPQTMMVKGKTTTVTFTPKKQGEYTVHCSVPCGSGHATMSFTVKVEA